MSGDIAARFWAKVDKSGDCWLWVGAQNGRGYGRFSINGRLFYAHRFSWEQVNGSIASGFVIDHLCRDPRCVRPEHLEPVAHGENTSRGPLGFKFDGTCRSGRHDITQPSAVYVQPSGKRRCRACHHENNKRSAA